MFILNNVIIGGTERANERYRDAHHLCQPFIFYYVLHSLVFDEHTEHTPVLNRQHRRFLEFLLFVFFFLPRQM